MLKNKNGDVHDLNFQQFLISKYCVKDGGDDDEEDEDDENGNNNNNEKCMRKKRNHEEGFGNAIQ